MVINLRPYQEKIVNEIRQAYADGFMAPIAVLPTGAGKTFIFSVIALMVKKRENSVLILAHREELWSQASESLDRLGVEHGIIAPRFGYSGDLVNVASAATLVRRLDSILPPSLIIIDEAHHCIKGNTWGKILSKFPNARVLGVTATPIRLDGSGLGKDSGGFFDIMLQGPQMRELQQMGYLSHYDYYCPPTDVDMAGVGTVHGDFDRHKLAEVMDKPMIIGSAVEHYKEICAGKPAIAFCASVAHAEHTAQQFKAAGFRALSIDGKMDKTARKNAIKALGEGRLDVLTSCDIISEGTDIPIVTAAILLRPTQSLGLYLQQCGRVLRPADGKGSAIILDHVGNIFRHRGEPNLPRTWLLNTESRKKRAKKEGELPPLNLKICDKCYTPAPPAAACLNCGFVFVVKESGLKQTDGELIKIESTLTPKQEAQKVKAEQVKARKREQGKARGLDELLQLAKQKGYKPEWALKMYQIRGNSCTMAEFEAAKIKTSI
jgi:DNA repair protein RadD